MSSVGRPGKRTPLCVLTFDVSSVSSFYTINNYLKLLQINRYFGTVIKKRSALLLSLGPLFISTFSLATDNCTCSYNGNPALSTAAYMYGTDDFHSSCSLSRLRQY